VLDDCEIGADCIIAAGALLPPNTKIPDGKVVMGIPGKIARDIKPDERLYIREVIESYIHLGRLHAAGKYPHAQQ
jgi:carbonic anhydrase/acetyltransferase-like protein (isoleucine patch superfamily)